jgi:hypothetical protein
MKSTLSAIRNGHEPGSAFSMAQYISYGDFAGSRSPIGFVRAHPHLGELEHV